MLKKVKQFFKDLASPLPAEVYVVTYYVGGQKLYFSNMKKKEVNFCTLAANAWWFGTEDDAEEVKDSLRGIETDYGRATVEPLTFKK